MFLNCAIRCSRAYLWPLLSGDSPLLSRRNGVLSVGHFEEPGCPHSRADAHGHHAVSSTFTLESVQEGRRADGAGRAEGVAEGDGAALGVHFRGVETEVADDGKRLRGEGFV